MRTHLIGLPQASDLGQHHLFEAGNVLLRHRDAIEGGQEFADAAALEHHGAARDLGGVGGKNWHDQHALEPVHRLLGGDADAAHLAQRAGQRAALAACLPAQLQRQAAALAVVGFGQVDQFEVKREGAGEQQGAFYRQRMDQLQCRGSLAGGLFVVAVIFGVAAANGALAQRFDVSKQVFAGLLAQHFAEQHAQRTHIAAERSFFQVAGLGFEFGQPLCPAFGIPQERHRVLIMHDGIPAESHLARRESHRGAKPSRCTEAAASGRARFPKIQRSFVIGRFVFVPVPTQIGPSCHERVTVGSDETKNNRGPFLCALRTSR